MNNRENRQMQPARMFLLGLVVAISLAFGWLVVPFWGAVLWAVIVAVLFDPLYQRLLRAMPGHPDRSAALVLLVVVAVVVLPALALGAALIEQGGVLYASVESGKIDPLRFLAGLQTRMPQWLQGQLGVAGLASLDDLRGWLGRAMGDLLRNVGPQLLQLGQSTLGLFLQLGVMLYLAYFLLRDGRALGEKIARSVPLERSMTDLLFEKFLQAVRATIKGSLIVAILQGTIGGLSFWVLGLPGALLWGVAMGVFSLFPSIGTGLVWVPVSVYLLATGSVWQGAALGALGFFVISSVDNLVRPILVGRDTRVPDYVVLITTLGGFELMGFNGFVMGPVIAALFIAIWQVVGESRDQA
ncbi:AI-2E family transporter [Novosphingobium sp. KACC 22771]|uniref:AI-2E family transporter n=1 Tax=Novosphingobium sp. KACC 22771 TaxID=3025670 RepID=UPI002366B9EC|nr:AI-2E family transporter [Novosphingobium sp. KACC 22771]WDF73835.1 AI-2E family transporter [Novosphingobium sp. KACC 22771]